MPKTPFPRIADRAAARIRGHNPVTRPSAVARQPAAPRVPSPPSPSAAAPPRASAAPSRALARKQATNDRLWNGRPKALAREYLASLRPAAGVRSKEPTCMLALVRVRSREAGTFAEAMRRAVMYHVYGALRGSLPGVITATNGDFTDVYVKFSRVDTADFLYMDVGRKEVVGMKGLRPFFVADPS